MPFARCASRTVRKLVVGDDVGAIDRKLFQDDRKALCQIACFSLKGRSKTMPNNHSDRARVGGLFQETGMKRALDDLSTAAALVAMLVCKYFQYDDLYVELNAHIDRAKSSEEQCSAQKS